MKVTDLHLDEDTIKFSDVLNTDIWVNEELKPQVYKKLMEIADAFIEYLDLDLNIVDIQFTGSMANYNFNKDSDIDLHIIADFEDFGINYDIISNYFNAKKSLFNQNHNISIYGHPVELYVEDKNQPSQSKGKYSLKFDKWLIKPQKITQEVEDVIDTPKYLEYIERFNAIVSSDYNAQEANDLLDELYNIRKEGLNKEGELSEDNLIFKALRSNGILKYLRQYINDNYDKSLSLTETLNKKIIEEDYKKDKEYRDIAKQMVDIVKKAINNKDTQLLNSSEDVYLNVTDEFNEIDDMFKNSGKEFYIRFCKGSENYSVLTANKGLMKLISFPILPHMELFDFMTYLFKKNKVKPSFKNNTEMNKEFLKLVLKYIKKHTKNIFNNPDNLVHEFIHILDDLRYSPTANILHQDIKTVKDYDDYHNSPHEYNAYYQETMYAFDNWVKELNKSDEYLWTFDEDDFNDFYNEFKRQYRGHYDRLNTKYRNKLRKRAFQYWKNTFKKED